MKAAFTFPTTPMCRVVYTRQGVNYSATIPTPVNTDGLVSAMLTRQAGLSQIMRIDPVQPRQEFGHAHPAQHRMVQYATAAEH